LAACWKRSPSTATASTRARQSSTPPPGRLLVVRHFYHLPRIELLARNAFTVLAREERNIRGTAWFVAREIAAFGWYLLR